MGNYDKGSRLSGQKFDGYKCPVCKKTFYIPDANVWAYTEWNGNRVARYCSWGCIQKARKEKEPKLKRPKYKYDTGRR